MTNTLIDNAKDIEPRILKEYDDIIFLYKPPFWDCHTPDTNLIDFVTNTTREKMLVKWIHDNMHVADDLLKCKVCRFGMVNRIDKETSGIVLVAKTVDSFGKYRKIINDHTKVTKIYVSLVCGFVKQTFGVITLPLIHNNNKNRTYYDQNGDYSYTEFINVATYNYDDKMYSLLVLKLKTGHTHQIRVHMKELGHVVFSDGYYAENAIALSKELSLLNRLFLHSAYYELPDNKHKYCKLPSDLKNTLKSMTKVKRFMKIKQAINILKQSNINNLLTE